MALWADLDLSQPIGVFEPDAAPVFSRPAVPVSEAEAETASAHADITSEPEADDEDRCQGVTASGSTSVSGVVSASGKNVELSSGTRMMFA